MHFFYYYEKKHFIYIYIYIYIIIVLNDMSTHEHSTILEQITFMVFY